MSIYFEKYRSDCNRLKGYDYTQDGRYFITINHKNNYRLFGEVVDGKMILNDIGKAVGKTWYEFPKHYNNLILGEFIVMPNHVHMIMIIKNDKTGKRHGISEFVRNFKSFSSKGINDINETPGKSNWQKDFWDRIIKNDTQYFEIVNYIRKNPESWKYSK
jgi:REP element-mobilizing transposase RayT